MSRAVNLHKAWMDLRAYFQSKEEFERKRESGGEAEFARGRHTAFAHAVEMMDAFKVELPPDPDLKDASQDKRLAEIGDWIVQTCLLYGAPAELAHEVAATFVKGLRKEWEKR